MLAGAELRRSISVYYDRGDLKRTDENYATLKVTDGISRVKTKQKSRKDHHDRTAQQLHTNSVLLPGGNSRKDYHSR